MFRSDRITIRDKEQESKDEEHKQRIAEMQNKLRKDQTRKLVAEAIASELQKEQGGEADHLPLKFVTCGNVSGVKGHMLVYIMY